MNLAESIAFLRLYNRWRRGEEDIPQPSPTTIGLTIDTVCDDVESMEKDLQTLIAWVDDGGDEDSQHLAAAMWAKYPKPE